MSTKQPNDASAKLARALLLPVYLPTLIISFCQGLLLPILPLYAVSFDISYGLIGLILAAEAVGTLLADIPSGTLIRQLDRKWVMVLGIGLLSLSVLALFWATNIALVFIARLVAGVGGALWNISRHAYLTEATPQAQRGRAIALFGGITRMGSFMGPAVAGLVASSFGLRTPFLLFAVLGLVATIISFIFVEPSAPRQAKQQARIDLLGLIHSHYQLLLSAGIAQLFAQMVRASRRVLIPLFAADILGLDVQSVGFIMSLSSFVDMSMFYPAGLIMDKLGRKFAIIPCFAIQGLGMALIVFTSGFWSLMMVACLIGFGNGLGSGTMMTLGADLAPKEALGEFLGVWRLIGDSGSMGGPVIVGAVAQVLSLPLAALVMAGVGVSAAAIFAYQVPETLEPAAAKA